jgi:hypothetical protein
MRMWWWLVMDMVCEVVPFSDAEEMDGDAVFEIGGVRGVVYCTDAACEGSTVCNMIAIW